MSEQDSSIISAPVVETSEGQSRDWYEAHRTSPKEQASATWTEERNRDIDSTKAIKQAMGLDYDAFRSQLDGLSSDERADLSGKTADEIALHLDARDEADFNLKRLEKEEKEQAAERFEAAETPHLREVRKAMKASYKEAASLDSRIAELQRLNDLRNDPSADGWAELPAEDWKSAREKTMESFDADISNLIQLRQVALQEAALHQNAYHAEAAAQPRSVPDRVVGFVGGGGQQIQVTQNDINTLVQLEIDAKDHKGRVLEAQQRFPDWVQAGRKALASGLDVPHHTVPFIQSLPNSADVIYHLITHADETRALSRMPPHEAQRTLINISHKASRPSTSSEARGTTKAPKPPSSVGGTSRGGFDVNDASTNADEWMRNRNADLARRRKL